MKTISNLLVVIAISLSLLFAGCEEEVLTPIVSGTVTVSEITDETAISGGVVSGDNGSLITKRGICWSTKENPTINDSLTVDSLGKSLGTGSFSSKMKNLLPSTKYYVRAYAVNANGVGYGSAVSFTTPQGLTLADYAGTWNGYEKGTITTYMSGYGSSTEAVNNTVSNVFIKKISDTKMLVGNDTADVNVKQLSFKTKKMYDSNFGMNVTQSMSGLLKYNKIEIYTTISSSYSMMGIDVSISQRTTTTLER
jgi:hypothetical protein